MLLPSDKSCLILKPYNVVQLIPRAEQDIFLATTLPGTGNSQKSSWQQGLLSYSKQCLRSYGILYRAPVSSANIEQVRVRSDSAKVQQPTPSILSRNVPSDIYLPAGFLLPLHSHHFLRLIGENFFVAKIRADFFSTARQTLKVSPARYRKVAPRIVFASSITRVPSIQGPLFPVYPQEKLRPETCHAPEIGETLPPLVSSEESSPLPETGFYQGGRRNMSGEGTLFRPQIGFMC